jgi:polyribonucleotide nucleotidyltransferase
VTRTSPPITLHSRSHHPFTGRVAAADRRNMRTRTESWCLVLTLLLLDSVRGFVPSSGVPFVRGHFRLNGASTASGQQHQQHGTTVLAETAVTTADFTLETEDLPTGKVHRLIFPTLPGQDASVPPIVMETGKIGRLAAGAVKVVRGDTVLYSTASRDADPKEGIGFLPLSVEHQERFSSAGMTSGSYNKRDGRPAEHEILVCRLIDRPLRPLIDPGWRHETQLLSWVLSYDGERSCDSLAIVAAATALAISDIPLVKPVAAVQVGLVNGVFLVHPTEAQMDESKLLLTVAGTADAVLMIEGEADFLPESAFLEGVAIGHQAIRVLCAGIQALSDAIGVVKKYDTIVPPPAGLQERVNELFTDRVDVMYAAPGRKRAKGLLMNQVQTAALAELLVEFPGQDKAIEKAFKNLLCNRMYECVKSTGKRGDGRAIDEIRDLTMETSFLPRVHGSALFTRGETQAIATATLGDSGMRQRVDKISGAEQKRFYLQYTFPPSCVGETGRVGAPGRRELGHGNLAERALAPTLPSEQEFPYSIRVESLITESHGSSSMASVCGGCLALMDAGVPIKKPIAGIAMGMLLDESSKVSGDSAIVLSDITGTEDALGTMDFKVAGDREGITTFQMDIKCEGLALDTMARALEQARIGRLHILDEMEKVMSAPRNVLPPSVPKMVSFVVPVESIGKLIGPGSYYASYTSLI